MLSKPNTNKSPSRCSQQQRTANNTVGDKRLVRNLAGGDGGSSLFLKEFFVLHCTTEEGSFLNHTFIAV